MLVAAALLLLGGCDLLFQIDGVELHPDATAGSPVDAAPQADAHANCLTDGFATLGGAWTTFAEPPMTAVAVDGALSITLNQAANAHAGLDSVMGDFTGASSQVDIVAVPDAASETYMDWQRGDDWYSIAVDHGELSYGFSVGGSQSTIEIPYSPDRHRGFRIAHDRQANLIRMSVRSSSGEWSQLGTVPVAIPMAALSVELASGSYTSATTTGVARFDNFVFCF